MDKQPSTRLDVSSVSPVMIAAAVIAAIILLALMPRTRRLYVAIAATMAWSLISQMPDLPVQPIAKATMSVAFVVICVAALLHPGPRLRLAPSVLWWLVMAVAAIMFVLYVDMLVYALLLRAQWILLCVTAILACRTMANREATDRMARAIAVGLGLGVLVAASSIAFVGVKAFHVGRLSPYGGNANQVGVVFAAAVPFALYCAIRGSHAVTRWGWAFMTAVAAGMVVMTASRTSVAVTGICVLPVFWSGMRRSFLILFGIGAGITVLLPFVYTPELSPELEAQGTYGLNRLDSLETERYELFAKYMDQSVSKRPLTGLLGTEEQSVLRDEDIGKHPHNAYIEMMYHGGILYTIPMLLLAAMTVLSGLRLWRQRRQLDVDPLLASLIAFFLFSVYTHAMVGGNGYYPTAIWAFLHVLLSCYALSQAAQLHRAARARQRQRVARARAFAMGAPLAAMLIAGCSGSNGKSEPRGEGAVDSPTAPRTADTRDGARERGSGRQRVRTDKNQMLPPDAVGREIDVVTHLEVDASDATPDVLCAVKLDVPADGPEVRKSARSLKVPMLVVAYNWIVDFRKDGQFDEQDQKRFAKWLDINIKPDSRQLVVIDYEHPYWPELRNSRTTTPERLAQIAAVYRSIYRFAKERRPKARFGFFGLPMQNNNMSEPWKKRVRELGENLLSHVDVVYLSIYDRRAGDRNGRDLEAVRGLTQAALAEAGGKPVYAFVRGRYGGRDELRDEPIPEAEFKAHIGAALDARWNDGKRDHRLAGIVLWDGRRDRRAKPFTWEELDKLYARQLRTVTDTVRARRKAPQ